MPLTRPLPDSRLRRIIHFEIGGDSEPLLYLNRERASVEQYWVRRTSFSPSMNKEPVYHVINGSGQPQTAALSEAGMQTLIDGRATDLDAYLAARASEHKPGETEVRP